MKGSVIVEEGYISCPYIPVGIQPMKWQEHLDYYSLRLFDGTTLPQMKLNSKKTILDIAQETFSLNLLKAWIWKRPNQLRLEPSLVGHKALHHF